MGSTQSKLLQKQRTSTTSTRSSNCNSSRLLSWDAQQQQQQQRLREQQEQQNRRSESSSNDVVIPLDMELWRREMGFMMLSNPFLANTTTKCEDAAAPPPPPLPAGTATAASSSAAAPPPPPLAAAEEGGGEDSIANAARSVSEYSSPGPYEQAVMDGKRLVMLDTFGGFRCDINKPLSPFMLVLHSFAMGTGFMPDGSNSSYTFSTQVADESSLYMARVDPVQGSVDGRIHRALLGGLLTGKLQVGVSTAGQHDQMLAELDLNGATWTGNLKYGSMGNGIVFGCNYFQAITPKVAMGGEGMYIAANQNMVSNYTLKFTLPARTGDEEAPIQPATSSSAKAASAAGESLAGSSTLCVNYNSASAALALNYKRVVTPNRVMVGAELQCSPTTLDSQFLVGAEFKLTRSRLSFCIDGGGKIQSLLETKLGMPQGSPTLKLSAELDHLKDDYKFGYGLTVGE